MNVDLWHKVIMKRALLTSIVLLGLYGCEGLNFQAPSPSESDDPHIARRNISHIFRDDDLAHQVSREIREQYKRYSDQIRVVVYQNNMLLLGQVPSGKVRSGVARIANAHADHRRVLNRISIEGAASTLVRTNDSWISTKIKAQMLSDYNLHASKFKVVTENGVVYLMGKVSSEEAALVTQIARQTTGVRKVVTILERT